MNTFVMNGIYWTMKYVPDNSQYLIDRFGNKTLGTTDPITKTIYISEKLITPNEHKKTLSKVVVHELGHCAIISYNLIDYIYKMVKQEYWAEAEEWLCNYICDYGLEIIRISDKLLKVDLARRS